MNDYIRRLHVMFNEGSKTGERLGKQYTIDSFQIAMGRYAKRSFGYSVIMEISEIAEQVRAEYDKAFDENPEADVYQDRLDRELREIVRGNAEFIPFGERYPEVKKQNYKGKRGKSC